MVDDPIDRIDPTGLCDNISYAPALYQVVGCRDSDNGQYAVQFNLTRMPWAKYSSPDLPDRFFTSGQASRINVPVRHPQDLLPSFGGCTQKDAVQFYLHHDFETWEINARNLLGENVGGADVIFDQTDSTWALADAIGIAYSPYNRVQYNRIAYQQGEYPPYLGYHEDGVDLKQARLSVSRVLLDITELGNGTKGQYAVTLSWHAVLNGYKDQGVSLGRYELALIIAYGVDRRLFMDTSYGAASYVGHGKGNSMPSAENWPYGFTCKYPSPTFFFNEEYKQQFQNASGLTAQELAARGGWPSQSLMEQYVNNPKGAGVWLTGYPPCTQQ